MTNTSPETCSPISLTQAKTTSSKSRSNARPTSSPSARQSPITYNASTTLGRRKKTPISGASEKDSKPPAHASFGITMQQSSPQATTRYSSYRKQTIRSKKLTYTHLNTISSKIQTQS